MTPPSMYVASLVDYRAGRDVGQWFDLDEYRNTDRLYHAIGTWLDHLGAAPEGPRTEWAIHDYQNVPHHIRAQLRRHNLEDYLTELNAPTGSMAHNVATTLQRRYSLPLYRVQLQREGAIRYHADCPDRAAPVLQELCCHRHGDREVMAALYLGSGQQLLGAEVVAIGGGDACGTDAPSIIRGAILAGARRLIIGHNHPSGNATPSDADCRMTEKIERACSAVDVPLLDHIIVTHDDAFSMYEAGLISKP